MSYEVSPDRPNRDGLPPGPVPIQVLLNRPEARMRFPRAKVIQHFEADEARSAPIEEINRGSWTRTFFTSRANEKEVVEWYKQELKARGWAYASRDMTGTMRVFLRGDTESLSLIMRPEGGFGRPRIARRGSLVYEVFYVVEGLGRARVGEPVVEPED